MKLVNIFRRVWLRALAIVLIAGTVLQYYIYVFALHRTTDDVLTEYRRDIETLASVSDSILSFDKVELMHSYLRIDDDAVSRRVQIDERIRDTIIISHYDDYDPVVYRVMNFPVKTKHQQYIVSLALPTLEQDEMIGAVTISSIGLVVLIVGASLFALHLMSRKLHPFYQLLDRIRTYDFRKNPPKKYTPTNIHEFDELGCELYELFWRMHNGYNTLKELIENTSHELQTPLAVIRMKLEKLEQQCNTDEQMLSISEIHDSLRHLSQYHHSLMIIARISSDRFYRQERIVLNDYLKRFVTNYEEFLLTRNIRVSWGSQQTFFVVIHSALAEILVNNLLSNAIKHNRDDGEINISLEETSLTIINDCAPDCKKVEGDLFQRYVCNREHKASTGIGLAIVREICERNKLQVSARYIEDRFMIKVSKV